MDYRIEIAVKPEWHDARGEAALKKINDFLRFNSIYDNIFYVTNVIRFYSDKKNIPKSIDDLLAYLLSKECKLHKLSENQMIAFSFYSMFSDTRDFEFEFGYSITSFSHQIIEEYATAIVLSHLSLAEILRYTTVEEFAIPNLKNTVGLLLNHILLYEEEKGNDLLEILIQNPENCNIFFKITIHLCEDFVISFLQIFETMNFYTINYFIRFMIFVFPCNIVFCLCSKYMNIIKREQLFS